MIQQKLQRSDFCSGKWFPRHENRPAPTYTPPGMIKARKGFRPPALSWVLTARTDGLSVGSQECRQGPQTQKQPEQKRAEAIGAPCRAFARPCGIQMQLPGDKPCQAAKIPRQLHLWKFPCLQPHFLFYRRLFTLWRSAAFAYMPRTDGETVGPSGLITPCARPSRFLRKGPCVRRHQGRTRSGPPRPAGG